MDNEIDKFRFFVVDENDKPRSSIWFIREKNDSVYISVKTLAGFLKLSIHPDGSSRDGKNCQIGLVRDYVKKLQLKKYSIPKLIRWSRPETPNKGATCVVSIDFPTDYLRADIKKATTVASRKKIRFALPIARSGCAVRVDIFYTKESPDVLFKKFTKLNFTPLGYMALSSDEFVIITARHIPFDSKNMPDFNSHLGTPLEGAPKKGQSIKNAHAVMWTEPKDGSLIILSEINGLTVSNK